MTDVSRLVRALRGYAVELERHATTVVAGREQLERSLARLASAYDGTGARQFQEHWATTLRGLDRYHDALVAIGRVLVERLEALETVDRPHAR